METVFIVYFIVMGLVILLSLWVDYKSLQIVVEKNAPTGYLINNGTNTILRVYGNSKTSFTDYIITHEDLEVKIIDDNFRFSKNSKGEHIVIERFY